MHDRGRLGVLLVAPALAAVLVLFVYPLGYSLVTAFEAKGGGFTLTGGDLGAVLHARPHEMLIIGGAVFALVHAIRRYRGGDPVNLALWFAPLVYLFVTEPPLWWSP